MPEHNHQKLLVILGPTSSGKSALAIDVAKKWDGEVISADSRQVYRGMDIGTGKVPRDSSPSATTHRSLSSPHYLSEGIPHHLLDVADPSEDYNVSHFVRDTRIAIDAIQTRGKLPIICGGTGFWIQALVENTSIPNVPPNTKLRETLAHLSKEALVEKLEHLNPERAKTIDRNNPRRLIRAIEIAEGTSHGHTTTQPYNHSAIQSFILTLCPSKELLDTKIHARLEERLKEGMIEEVERLHQENVSWERLDRFGLEYRWISRFLKGDISEMEMKEKLAFDIIHYAKRQMTWIRRWQRQGGKLHIVETPEKALEEIQVFLEST